ncbi:MAG: alpha/beta hydrolase [Acidimicrobiales bacterium]
MRLSRPAGGLLGAGMIAIAGLSAVKVAGGRLRHRTDPVLDSLATGPAEPVHHRIPTADGGELHVVESGDPAAQPVVLMHGVTLQWWVWSSLMELLGDRYRVLAWDMRGHGESRAGSDGVSLEATAVDLATLLRELGLEDAIVVGHSMGGMTIGQFVRDHRAELEARVAALYFVATSGSAIDKVVSRGSLRTAYGAVGLALVNGLKRPMPYPWKDNDLSAVLLRAAFGHRATAVMIEQVREMVGSMSTATMIEAGNAIALHDVRDVLGAIDVPTAVVVGDTDRITPPGHAREIAELVKGATLTVLPGVGHQIMQEDPEALVSGIDELAARARRVAVDPAPTPA